MSKKAARLRDATCAAATDQMFAATAGAVQDKSNEQFLVDRFDACALSVSPAPANAPNECWSIDFVCDETLDGRRFRALTVVDNCSRMCPQIKVATKLPARAVIAALDEAIARAGKPNVIRLDNGSEFTSLLFETWANRRRIRLDFIAPGKPTENAFIESFNGKLRDECLATNAFGSIADAGATIEAWRLDYNITRPHSALGGLAPAAPLLATRFEQCGVKVLTFPDLTKGSSRAVRFDRNESDPFGIHG